MTLSHYPELKEKQLRAIRKHAKDCYKKGQTLDDNPYIDGTEEHRTWELAYNQARLAAAASRMSEQKHNAARKELARRRDEARRVRAYG